MSIVRFATLCDICQKRSEEYSRWYTCRDCGSEVCNEHLLVGTEDSETGTGICVRCPMPVPFTPAEVEKIAAGIEAEDRADDLRCRESAELAGEDWF